MIIALLHAFRLKCGGSSFDAIVSTSERLGELYPAQGEVPVKLEVLSKTAVSEILGGKRKGPPRFDWIASFVLSCQRLASEKGVISRDPGIAILPEWARKLAVLSADRRTPRLSDSADATRDRRAAASLMPEASTMPEAATAGERGLASGPLTQEQRDFITSHGRYGLVLLAEVGQGSAEALYRVALLLAADPAHTEQAGSLLITAAAALAAYLPACDLLDARDELLCREAAGRAHELAQAAQAGDRADEAAAFYLAAARGGIGDAAIEHIQVFLTEHGNPEAARWLAALTTQPSSGRHRTQS